MSDEIKISKKNLWMYSTFVLLAVVIIGGVLLFSGGGNSSTGNATTGGVNLEPFLSNSLIYPSLGPEDADDVVIEFADFQCPWCAVASGLPQFAKDAASSSASVASVLDSAGKVQQLATEGKVRFVYVPMSFLGSESVYSAQAGLCANQQEKFWEMHDAIFTAHDGSENNGKYSKANLKAMAKDIDGLDVTQFNDCLDNDKTLSAVQTAATQARTAATGTPTFYVNGVKTSASWTAIQAALG